MTQGLGSYASEEYGGSVHFSVTWKSEVTLNLVKADAANTNVRLAGAVIGVYADADCTQQLTTMTTGADSSASCTLTREYTRLYLKELNAPTGYRLSKTVYTVDMPDGDSITVMVKDEEQRAGLKITKRGEVLTGADVTDKGVRFIYESRKLSGATFRVTAGGAIYAPDGSLRYQKGDVVADGLTTNDSGEVTLNDLPQGAALQIFDLNRPRFSALPKNWKPKGVSNLGTYVVEETQAPSGVFRSTEKKTVELAYAGQDAEAAFNETSFTNERQKADLKVYKQDGDTKNPLKGTVFALYADSAITGYKGDALVSAGTLIETATTGADGGATFTADLPVGFKYVVREITPPAGYTYSVDKYAFSFNAVEQAKAKVEFSHTFLNDRITASLKLCKQDAEKVIEQGDAQLSGAVYALYAREAIVHPDGKTGTLYAKDALVTSLTTDAAGNASVEKLPLGKYYLKEVTPSAGYLLDAKEYEVDCSQYDPSKSVVLVESIVKEQVIKQPFQIIKAAWRGASNRRFEPSAFFGSAEKLETQGVSNLHNGKTDADLIKGAGFTAWKVENPEGFQSRPKGRDADGKIGDFDTAPFVSDLMKNADGSYDFSSADPVALAANGATEIFTDETGHATSIPLPFGTYIVRETTTPKDYAPVDDFIVNIKENHPTNGATLQISDLNRSRPGLLPG